MSVAQVIADVRRTQPLVHCITATVSMAIVADGLLAAGARPMMTETAAEAPALDALADALLVNLGTLSVDGLAGIPPTVAAASARCIPWVLDPAAIGVAPVRTPLARELISRGPALVRGNASEILALAGGRGGRGADSTATTRDAHDAAVALARRWGTVVAVSGVTDLIVGADRTATLTGGSDLLPRVTGTGCLLGGLAAACAAVAAPFDAAVAAVTWLNRAGELAAGRHGRPGSFRIGLLDALDEVD